MIRTIVAHTVEVDDVQVAVDEIKEQLNLDENLLKSSIGIIACHYEFVDSGVAKAVCDALPFDVVGAIASPLCVNGEMDSMLMAITLLTSDDVEFASALSSSLMESPKEAVAQCYQAAAKGYQNRPGLVLAYAPFIAQNAGDDYVNAISEVSNHAPCFGTVAVDDTADFSSCFVLHNGDHYPDRMAMVLVYGDIKPKFYLANMSPEKVLDKSAVVTKSMGHVVMEINGRSVDEYFADLGLAGVSDSPYALANIPFLIDHNDGTPKVSKVFIRHTPERYALFASAIPEGCTLYVGSTDKEDVFLTASKLLEQLAQDSGDADGLLLYSCIARTLALSGDSLGELSVVNSNWEGKLPFMMAYSGGEMCPTQTTDGRAVNRFHNNALIALLF